MELDRAPSARRCAPTLHPREAAPAAFPLSADASEQHRIGDDGVRGGPALAGCEVDGAVSFPVTFPF